MTRLTQFQFWIIFSPFFSSFFTEISTNFRLFLTFSKLSIRFLSRKTYFFTSNFLLCHFYSNENSKLNVMKNLVENWCWKKWVFLFRFSLFSSTNTLNIEENRENFDLQCFGGKFWGKSWKSWKKIWNFPGNFYSTNERKPLIIRFPWNCWIPETILSKITTNVRTPVYSFELERWFVINEQNWNDKIWK